MTSIDSLAKTAGPRHVLRSISASQRVWLLAWGAFLVIAWLFWATSVHNDRQITLENVRNQTGATARLMADHAERIIEGGDSMLQWMAVLVEGWDWRDPVRGQQIHRLLAERVASSPQISSAWIVDADGRGIMDNWHYPLPAPVNVTHRKYYEAHLRGGQDPYVEPAEAGTVTGRPRFTISHGIRDPDGSLRGIAVVGVFSDYFSQLYGATSAGDGAQFALRLREGPLLAHWPPNPDAGFGALAALDDRLERANEGFAEVEGDGGRSFVAWHKLATQPIYAVVGEEHGAALTAWRERAVAAGLAVLGASAALSFLVLLGLRSARAEQAAIAELRESNATLDRRIAERTAALMRTESRLHASQELSPDGFMILRVLRDAHGRIADFALEYANPVARRVAVRAPHAATARKLLQRFFGERAEDMFVRYVRTMESGQSDESELPLESEGAAAWVRIVATRIDEGLAVHFSDISARKEAEIALRDSESLARRHLAEIEAVYATAPVGLCVLDRDLRFVRINDRLAEINGVPAADHIGRHVGDIVPAIANEVTRIGRRVLSGREIKGIELSGETPAQPGVTRTWLEDWFPLRDGAGNIVGVNVVVEEITERKRDEDRMRQLLARNAMLLREVHHRVKNNLQLIASLLNIQGRAIGDAQARSQFEALQRRVRAIASVHETIYRTEDFENVELSGLLMALCDDLARSVGSAGQVAVACAEPIYVPSEKAVAVALAINELVTNALKHGSYDAGSRVQISCALTDGGREVLVRIEDDGPGLPTDFDLTRPQGFGLRMALALVGQAQGTLVRVPCDRGAAFELRMPPAAKAAATAENGRSETASPETVA